MLDRSRSRRDVEENSATVNRDAVKVAAPPVGRPLRRDDHALGAAGLNPGRPPASGRGAAFWAAEGPRPSVAIGMSRTSAVPATLAVSFFVFMSAPLLGLRCCSDARCRRAGLRKTSPSHWWSPWTIGLVRYPPRSRARRHPGVERCSPPRGPKLTAAASGWAGRHFRPQALLFVLLSAGSAAHCLGTRP